MRKTCDAEDVQCRRCAAKIVTNAGGVVQSDFIRHRTKSVHRGPAAELLDLLYALDPLVLRWGR